MSAVPFQPNQRFGQYTLTRPIASGGMAEVWLARLDGPQGFQKKVALKRMTGTLAEQPQFVTMFLEEARLLSGLTHPNICQVMELGEREESFFVVMEFIDGQTVHQLMRAVTRAHQRLPVELAVKIVRDAADALHYAHTKADEQGAPLHIIHRDVSPQNLMVTYEGVPKLLDFGIAKSATRSNSTEVGQLKGKLSYMPPEQARGEALDPRADQFSLGVTLFEMLTHTRLYPTLKEMDLFRLVAMAAEPYESPAQRDPTVPAELSALVARMMDRDVEKRFATMAEVRDLLTTYLHGLSQVSPSNEALAAFMRTTFPPETREKESSTQSTGTSLPIVQGALTGSSLAPRPRRNRALALGALAVFGLGALAFALWPATPPPVVVLEPPRAPPPVVVDAGPPALAVVEPPPPETEPEPLVPLEGLDLTVVDAGPAKPPRPAVPRGKGLLSLQTSPWSNVFFGKKNLGETPLVGVSLPAGRQRLTLINDERKLKTTIEVEIKPGQTTTLKLKL